MECTHTHPMVYLCVCVCMHYDIYMHYDRHDVIYFPYWG